MMANRFSLKRASKAMDKDEEDAVVRKKTMEKIELKRLTREIRMIKEIKVNDLEVEKQTKVRNILQKEKDSLEANLGPSKNTRQCLLDNKHLQDITNLVAQGDDLDTAIAQEKKYIKDLEYEIQKETQKMHQFKKDRRIVAMASSEFMLKKENERTKRTSESWNSRLAAEQNKLALAMKENEEMRNKLKNLLMEKAQFNKRFEENIQKLKKSKHILNNVVEQSRQQFRMRDDVCRKIEALKSRDKVDLEKRMEEMYELEMKLNDDKRLAEYKHRIQLWRHKLDEGEVIKCSIATIEKERIEARLSAGNELLHDLEEFTGLKKIEDICDYIKKEDANLFSMFNFNNEVRDQLEVLMQKNVELLKTADEEHAASEAIEAEDKKVNYLLKNALLDVERQHSDLVELYNNNSRLFIRLLDKIKALFDILQCKTSPLEDLLDFKNEITEFNYRLFLDLIESELISVLDRLPHHVPFEVKTLKSIKSFNKSAKSTMSRGAESKILLQTRRVITLPCGECDDFAPRRKI